MIHFFLKLDFESLPIWHLPSKSRKEDILCLIILRKKTKIIYLLNDHILDGSIPGRLQSLGSQRVKHS